MILSAPYGRSISPLRDKFAIKRMKDSFEGWDEVRLQRELLAAKMLPVHTNVVQTYEVHYDDRTQVMHLVFEYMDGGSLYDLLLKQISTGILIEESEIQSLLRQILQGVNHCHSHGIMHRDLKPENILLKKFKDCSTVCKLADFSLARRVPSGNFDKHNRLLSPATSYVCTRWYRAPEILLSDKLHSYPVDIFATGCIMAELYELQPLFPGETEVDQLHMLIKFLGGPTKETWLEGCQLANQKFNLDLSAVSPVGAIHYFLVENATSSPLPKLITPPTHKPHCSRVQRLSGSVETAPVSSLAFPLFQKLVELNPHRRLTGEEAIEHDYFRCPSNGSISSVGTSQIISSQPTHRRSPTTATMATASVSRERKSTTARNRLLASVR